MQTVLSCLDHYNRCDFDEFFIVGCTVSYHDTSRCNPLLRRHNDHDSVSNHQPHGCLFSRLFRHRWKKTSKLRVTGLCVGNSPGPVNSPHKGPVTRKMFTFDDVIMQWWKFRQNEDISPPLSLFPFVPIPHCPFSTNNCRTTHIALFCSYNYREEFHSRCCLPVKTKQNKTKNNNKQNKTKQKNDCLCTFSIEVRPCDTAV